MSTAGAPAARSPYSEAIRERWRRPRFRGTLPDATAVAEDVNPLCGDRVRITVRVEQGRVAAARFLGDACAICTASADVVAELSEGQPVEAVRELTAQQVRTVLGAELRRSRLRCLTLPLAVMAQALGGAEERA